MQIIRAKVAGFCFGVERAYELTQRARGENIQIVGELIHNPQVVAELESRGIRTVRDLKNLKKGTAIVRAHGTSNVQKAEIKKRAGDLIDASCPFVIRLHTAAGDFVKAGLPVVIVGRSDHPEMIGVVEDYPAVIVTTNSADPQLQNLAHQEVGLLVQTTETTESLSAIRLALQKQDCQIHEINTICNATTERQEAVLELAEQVEKIVVIGGRNSNNTKNLFELAKEKVPSYWIETEDELSSADFAGVARVGVTAGASTPESRIEAVCVKLESF